MHETCHRCGEDIAIASASSTTNAYCPHCGAPQLYLPEYVPSDSGVVADGPAAPPPPLVSARQIDWRVALRSAAIVAAGGAVLTLVAAAFPVLGMANWIWVISGSVIALGIYQKQRPLASMDARVGARIGVVVGVLLSAALALATAIVGVVARFGTRSMGSFDGAMNERLHEQVKQMAQTNPVPPDLIGFFYSPEFVAGMMLTVFAIAAGVVIAISMAGGAFAGMMRAAKRV
jgi:hypothetical protein